MPPTPELIPGKGSGPGFSLCSPLGVWGSGGVSPGVGGLIARKNAAKLQGGIKNCGLFVLWLGGGVKRLAKYVVL